MVCGSNIKRAVKRSTGSDTVSSVILIETGKVVMPGGIVIIPKRGVKSATTVMKKKET